MYRETIGDWISLLGLEEPLEETFAGRATVRSAIAAIAEARTQWPGVAQDYVAVVDAIGREVAALRDAVNEQNVTLTEARDRVLALRRLPAVWDVSIAPIPVPDDRLLNEQELERLTDLPDDLERLADSIETYAQYLEALAQEMAENTEGPGGGGVTVQLTP
ncbi:MAG: hypothetical protein AB7I08_06755 [Thermoleophilia bacterium]